MLDKIIQLIKFNKRIIGLILFIVFMFSTINIDLTNINTMIFTINFPIFYIVFPFILIYMSFSNDVEQCQECKIIYLNNLKEFVSSMSLFIIFISVLIFNYSGHINYIDFIYLMIHFIFIYMTIFNFSFILKTSGSNKYYSIIIGLFLYVTSLFYYKWNFKIILITILSFIGIISSYIMFIKIYMKRERIKC